MHMKGNYRLNMKAEFLCFYIPTVIIFGLVMPYATTNEMFSICYCGSPFEQFICNWCDAMVRKRFFITSKFIVIFAFLFVSRIMMTVYAQEEAVYTTMTVKVVGRQWYIQLFDNLCRFVFNCVAFHIDQRTF